MAKKMRKLMAMVMALSMMTSMLGMTAFAADKPVDGTYTETNGDLTTVVTTTTKTEEDANGNTTVTITVEKNTNGTNEQGEAVEAKETEVKTTVTDADGNVVSVSKSEEGKEVTSEVVPGDDEISIDVMEDGKVSDDLSGSSGTADSSVTGEEKMGEDDPSYDQTTVTVTDRTADVTVENITVETSATPYVDENGQLMDNHGEGFDYYWSEIYDIDGKSYYDGEAGEVRVGRVYGYIVKADGTKVRVHSDAVIQRVVSSENGTPDDKSDDYEIGGLYCSDSSTGVTEYMEYRKANLEDADYYDAETAAHLRGIMKNGYTWDDDDDNGYTNLENIKTMLRDAQENGDEAVKEMLKDMDIDNLTREQAATATGMAVWHYGNRFELEEGDRIEFVSRDTDAANKARIETLYRYLLTLTADAEEDTQIINEEKFVDDLQMNIGGMAQGAQQNSDDNDTNDVYDVELKFSLVVKPSMLNDDLIVKVLDENGKTVKTARIAGTPKEGERFGYAKTEIDENGKTYYILEGLELAENSTNSFNLKLEGSQALKEGVYIFESQHLSTEEHAEQYIEYYRQQGMLDELIAQSPEGTLESLKEDLMNYYSKESYDAQNFIGKFSGTAEVNVGVQIDMSFNVEEAVVTTERIWRSESNGEDTPNNPNEPVIFDGNHVIPRPLDNLPDEEVPLADAPQTGDEAMVFAALAILAGMGLMAMQVSEQKRKEEA